MKICSENDYFFVQNNLNTIVDWTDIIGLEDNLPKYYSMIFFRNHASVEFVYSLFDFSIVSIGNTVKDHIWSWIEVSCPYWII